MQEYIDFARNHPILIFGFVAILTLVIKTEISRFTRKYKQININEAVSLMNKDNTSILDVREDKEIQGGMIKGAKHITLRDLSSKIAEVGNKQTPVLVYCRTGSRSGYACNILTKAGYEDVSNLTGGIMAWESANLPVVKR